MACQMLHTQSTASLRGRAAAFSCRVQPSMRAARPPFSPFTSAPNVRRLSGVQRVAPVSVARSTVMAAAAEEKKKEKKKVKPKDSVEVRERVSEQNRMYNKARRTGVANRIKKVIKLAEEIKAKIQNVQREDDLAPLTQLINEAYSSIDKAVSKGVFHGNTAARKKARVAKYRRNILVAAGLYQPEASS